MVTHIVVDNSTEHAKLHSICYKEYTSHFTSYSIGYTIFYTCGNSRIRHVSSGTVNFLGMPESAWSACVINRHCGMVPNVDKNRPAIRACLAYHGTGARLSLTNK